MYQVNCAYIIDYIWNEMTRKYAGNAELLNYIKQLYYNKARDVLILTTIDWTATLGTVGSMWTDKTENATGLEKLLVIFSLWTCLYSNNSQW